MLSREGKISVSTLTVLTVLATITVALRLAKRRTQRMLGADDWVLVFALLMLYLQDAGAFLFAIKGGIGKPFVTLSADERNWLFQMMFWPALGYTILVATIKFSILISYTRIFGRIRWFRHAVYVLALLTAMWLIGVFFSLLFQCTPVSKAWNPMKPGRCIDFVPFLWGNSISNTVLDWIILCLPSVPVWKLQMGPTQRCLVLGSFLLGSLACVASTLRCVTTGTVDMSDLSKSVFVASIWTYIEPGLGIISACLPYLANLFGQKIMTWMKTLSSLGSRTMSRLPFLSSRGSATRATGTSVSRTRASEHDFLELDGGTDQGSAASERRAIKAGLV